MTTENKPFTLKQVESDKVNLIATATGETVQEYKISGAEISDGYHTFSELYDHRCLLFLCWLHDQMFTRPIYWIKNHYPGWDCVVIEPGVGQISYHIPEKHRHLYEMFEQRAEQEHEFDGHTSADVLKRLEENCKSSFWK